MSRVRIKRARSEENSCENTSGFFVSRLRSTLAFRFSAIRGTLPQMYLFGKCLIYTPDFLNHSSPRNFGYPPPFKALNKERVL